MSSQKLDFAEPFFTVTVIENESSFDVQDRSVLLNLSELPIFIEGQSLGQFQSAIFTNITVRQVTKAVLVEGLDREPDETALFAAIKKTWPSAFEVRGEERLRGISHYMSPKIWIERLGLTIYHSGSVPLNVGLHKDHAFLSSAWFSRGSHTACRLWQNAAMPRAGYFIPIS